MVPYAYLIGKMYAMGGEKRVKRLDFVSKKRDFKMHATAFHLHLQFLFFIAGMREC